MINQSFIFLEKVGKETEQNIFEQGVISWDDFLKKEKIKGLSRPRKLCYDRQLLKAKNALYSLDSRYFAGKIHQSEMWRLYDFFRDDAVFVDIEMSETFHQSLTGG